MTKKQLFLADLSERTEAQIKDHIAENYAGDKSGFDYGNPTEAEKNSPSRVLGKHQRTRGV